MGLLQVGYQRSFSKTRVVATDGNLVIFNSKKTVLTLRGAQGQFLAVKIVLVV